MCKQFTIEIKGKGAHADIVRSLHRVIASIENTPTKLTRITAKFVRLKLSKAHNENDFATIQDTVKEFSLHNDYCEKCNGVTPTIRTSKHNRCAFCDTDRLQDITHTYKDVILKATLNEIDK